jgi:4'-phosphopantetheinyl transferase EntD
VRRVFPATVVVRERRTPGNAADLLASEAAYVHRAHPKRISEFAAGRSCAKSALAEFGVRDIALHPADDRQPVWPSGFIGTITHTAGLCVAAVAERRSILAIGMDSEIVGAPTADIWPTICGAAELNWLRSLPVADQPAAVTLLFSAKEAFYKCQYPLAGEWLDFHDLRIEVPQWPLLEGTFWVSAERHIEFTRHVDLPLVGRYVFHEEFVSAAVTVPAPVPAAADL